MTDSRPEAPAFRVAIAIADAGLARRAALALAFPPTMTLAGKGRHADLTLTDSRPIDPHDGAILALIDPHESVAALRAGARAVLPKDATEEVIRLAIDALRAGLSVLPAETARFLAGQTLVPSDAASPSLRHIAGSGGDLTAREREVLRLVAEGASNKEIARRLDISVHTVKFHVASILNKLDATGRTDAVTQAVRLGLVMV